MTVHSNSRAKRSAAVTRKLRTAIVPATRSVVESLENRLLLTVAMDPNGWTVVTPTPGVSRLIYVSSSTGSDANSGLSPAAPLRSITAAYNLLAQRNNEPDWILFKRGDTFAGSFSFFNQSGLDAQDPLVITSYGDPTLPRPVIDSGAVTAFRTGSYNHDVYILDVSFTSSTHNPTSANFNGQGSYGFYDAGNTTNIFIEDCSFSYFINDITFTDINGPMFNVTVRRSEILDAYDTAGHSQGLYADTVTNLTITDNVFDHDGWNADVPGAGATIFNQDCYLHSSNVNCLVVDNVFSNAGSFGLEARAGGIVENNLFINDPYGFAFGLVNGATTAPGGVSGTVSGNVVMEPRVDNANGWGIGAFIGNIKPGGNTLITNNIFSGEPGGTQPAIIFEPGTGVSNPQQEVGLNSITFSNNTTYDWGFGLQISNQYVPGTTGSTGLTSVVIKNNNFQDNVVGRIINHGDPYDPRYEDWSGNTYSSTTAAQSSWFTYNGIATSFASWLTNIEPTAIAATVPFIDPNRTIESYMAAEGLGTTEAAFIAGARNQNEQNWNPLYLATTVNSYVQGGYIVVSNPPTAAATPPSDVTPGNYLTNPAPTFIVTFSDAAAMNVGTITSSAVTITGVGGFSLPVSLVGTSGSGASVTATYQVSAPAGDWTTVPNGTYVISVVGGQVKDTTGLTVTAGPLASFQVTVNADANPPSAPATTPVGLNAVAGASSITVSWSDPAADQRSFILERALDAGFTQGVVTIPLTADQTTYIDHSVSAATTYYYELIAVNPLGNSAPTSAVSVAILPPVPVLSRVFFDDGNTSRTAITCATLLFTQPVNVPASAVNLVQTSTATPIAITVANPSGDGKTWIVSWNTGTYNNSLTDGNYSLTVHGGLIADAFGQTAGGDHTTNFTCADGPVVTLTVRNTTTPPHSIAISFSQDISATLSASSLVLTGSKQPSSFSWNAATLTGTWTFTGALADGSYTATLAAAGVSNSDGVHLDGNRDGIPGDNYTYSFSIAKPTLTLTGASHANVGATYSLTLGAITDAGQTNPSYLVHWGDGTTSTATAAGALTHVYSTVGSPMTISVDVIDANGTHVNCASMAISVNRANIALSGNSNANPNATYTLTLGAVTDPGFTVSSYIVHWGDGTSNTYSTNGAVTHAFSNTGGSGIARQITVDLVDNSGAGGANFTNVTAATLNLTANAYPFVPTTGVLNANVGGNYTVFIGNIVDPGFTVSQLSINWGDGSAAQSFAVGTTQLSHVFLPGAPLADSIRVTLTDNSGTYPNASVFPITVNPKPTVGLSGNPAAAVGSNYSLTVAPANDPAQAVTLYTVNWGDGTSTSMTAPGLFNHVYTTAASDTITVDITDGTGFFAGAGSLPVSVTSSASIALSGNANANAGGIYTLNLGAVNDPGQTVTQYTVNWGDGRSNNYNAGGAVTHTYAAQGSYLIGVDLTDTAGITYTAAGTMSVSVGKPTVTLAGKAGVFIGQTYSLTVNPANDLGGTPVQYTVNWGDGTNSVFAATGSPIAATHVYSTTQRTAITADLVDTTGAFVSAGTLALLVAPTPALTLSGAPTAAVGSPYTLTLGQASDALGTVSSYIVHWGDNTTSTVSAAGPVSHVYSTAGSQAISVDLVDQNGTYANAASTSVVVGVAPTIGLTGNADANVNGAYTLNVAAPSDLNGTPSSYLVHWGDGSSSTFSTAPGALVHTYTTAGAAKITIDLTDPAGTWVSAGSLAITVSPSPTIALSGNGNANVTGTYTLTLGAVSDPGYVVSQYTVNWGDTTSSTYTTAGPVTHTYSGTGSFGISASLTDTTGTFANAGTLGVKVNAKPSIALSGATTGTVGAPYSLTLGAVSDPGYAPSLYTVHWGDGTISTYQAGGVVTHTYASAVNATIQVDLTDSTGVYTNAGQKALIIAAVPPAASISGTVFNDINGDGVQDKGETGVAGVRVYEDPNYNHKIDAGEQNVLTDSNGNFTFTNLPADPEILRIILPSGAQQTFPANGIGQYVGKNLTQSLTGENFGIFIPVVANASISGAVFNDANLDGVQDSGEQGITGVTVYLDLNNSGSFVAGDPSATTQAQGLYFIGGLVPGTYTVREIVPAGDTQSSPPNNGGIPVTLAANQQANSESFGLVVPPPAGTGTISGTVFNDANGDGVQDNGETGIAGATVFLDLDGSTTPGTGEPSVLTGADGTYTLPNVTAGIYILREIPPQGDTQTTPSNDAGISVMVVANQTTAGENFGVLVPAGPPAGSISGTVFNDANRDGVQDNGETGIPGVRVYEDPNYNHKIDAGEQNVLTDANGNFIFTNVPADPEILRIILPNGAQQTFPANGIGIYVGRPNGQTLTDENFGIFTPAVGPSSGSITGTVFNDLNGDHAQTSGEPNLSNVTVFIDANNDGVLDAGDPTAVTNASGAFTFTGLAAGGYTVLVSPGPGFRQTFPVSGGTHVTVPANSSISAGKFGVTTTAYVGGYLFNDTNGNGVQNSGEAVISGWKVYIDLNKDGVFQSSEPASITSGGYWYFRSVATGTYTIRVVAPSGWTTTHAYTVTLSSGQTITNGAIGVKQ